MKEMMIKLSTLKDVQNLVTIVEKFSFPVDLVCGRYVVDAKSIMGVYSLDLMSEIKLVAHGDSDELFALLEQYKA